MAAPLAPAGNDDGGPGDADAGMGADADAIGKAMSKQIIGATRRVVARNAYHRLRVEADSNVIPAEADTKVLRAEGGIHVRARSGSNRVRASERRRSMAQQKPNDPPGKDATDGPVQLKADCELVFVLSDRPAVLTGSVRQSRGAPDVNAMVVIFPANRQLWTDYGLVGWRVRSTTTMATGAYTLQDLVAGDYFVTVVPDAMSDNWSDPKTLDALSRTAIRVTIDDGDRKSIDLTTPGPIR